MHFCRIKILVFYFTVIASLFFTGVQSESVITQGAAKLWKNGDGALTCKVTGSPTQVTWTKDTNPLAIWNSETGTDIPNPRFNITRDFTLLIKNVAISDEGSYSCLGSYSGTHVVNKTTVTVYVQPDDSFPHIDQCASMMNDGDDGDHDEQCKFVLDNETATVNLTCSSDHFYPENGVQLAWTNGGNAVAPIGQELHNNTDSTKCLHVHIAATPSNEPYVCTMSGDALKGGDRSVRASIVLPEMTSVAPTTTEEPEEGDGGLELWIIIVIAVGSFVAVVILGIIIYNIRKRRSGRKEKRNIKYKKTADKDESINVEGQ